MADGLPNNYDPLMVNENVSINVVNNSWSVLKRKFWKKVVAFNKRKFLIGDKKYFKMHKNIFFQSPRATAVHFIQKLQFNE